MAVAFITGSGLASRYGNPLPYTLGAGADFVFAGSGSNADDAAATRATVGAMAELGSIAYSPGFRAATAFGQVNPTAGEQNFEVTSAGNVWGLAIASFSGVDPSTPASSAVSNGGDSTTPTLTVPDVPTGGLAVIVLAYSGSNASVTLGTDEVLVAQNSTDGRNIAILYKPGTGNVSFAPTISASMEWGVVGVALLAAAGGPTITTQPVADIGLINGDLTRRTTVYTAIASGTNVLAPTWSEDGSPIADGGIYDIVTTGAGTSECTSTLTITRATKPGTPPDISANFVDDNGDTDTDTVPDTWFTGPTFGLPSGTTDVNGQVLPAPASDYPNADGEFTIITANDSPVTIPRALHFTAP